MKTVPFLITVPMGKRLIAKGLLADPAVMEAMVRGRLLIVAGTTNAYVAQEALRATGSSAALDSRSFRRGGGGLRVTAVGLARGAAVAAGAQRQQHQGREQDRDKLFSVELFHVCILLVGSFCPHTS